MASVIYKNELIIDDEYEAKNRDSLMGQARGYDPDSVDPSIYGMMAPPSEIKLIPRSEWSERIKEKERTKSNLSDLLRRAGIPSTDQNGHGYCWAYSTVGCVQTIRAFNNQPHIPLNPHSVAATIKRGANQGGWCGLSCRFLMEHGVAPMGNGADEWPEHSRDYKSLEPRCRERMSQFIVTEGWIDLRRNDYDQQMTFDQVASCLLSNIPCALDFNWWGHSVMCCDLVEVEAGDFGLRIRNSWKDSWGDKGFSVLRGSRAKPNGAVGLCVTGGVAK
jgi:hypothetical protein